MNRIYFAILLVLIPVLSFTFQYYFSKRENLLKSFKRHFTCYYLDWIFVPFNFCIAFILNLNAILLYCFLISFIFTLVSHIFWLRKNNNGHMFNSEKKRISFAGVVHFIFMTFELGLILAFIFVGINNLFTYLCSFVLVIFFFMAIYGSKRIHGRVAIDDLLFLTIGIVVVVSRIVYAM